MVSVNCFLSSIEFCAGEADKDDSGESVASVTATPASFTVKVPGRGPIVKNTADIILPPSGKAPPYVGTMRRPVGRPPKKDGGIGKKKVGRPPKVKE